MHLIHEINSAVLEFLNNINEPLGLILLGILIVSSVWFCLRTRFVQVRCFKEMITLICTSNTKIDSKHISSLQAFLLSIASRIGTGNLAGVATAIVIGGPGAIFWMWVMAITGAASAFAESTLAQLFKSKDEDAYIGGPAYYIYKGLKSKGFAVTYALFMLVYAFSCRMVQSNTISQAFSSAFGIDTWIMAIIITGASLIVFYGGIHRIALVSTYLVPLMAVGYLLLAFFVVVINIDKIPFVILLIVKNAFGIDQFMGGSVGTAILIGFKRGLFSNEAGEGTTPNAAATAQTSHPVKQGLIQALGVYTDTIVVCSCTAFIILCSGLFNNGQSGIELTQTCLNSQIGPSGSIFIAIAVLMFAYTTIIANYYYGDCNLHFITSNKLIRNAFCLVCGVSLFWGAISSADLAWAFVDLAMFLMAITNVITIFLLSKYVILCLNDYLAQRKQGLDPVYHKSTIPEIADDTECWDD